jgi:hypothetical protein
VKEIVIQNEEAAADQRDQRGFFQPSSSALNSFFQMNSKNR